MGLFVFETMGNIVFYLPYLQQQLDIQRHKDLCVFLFITHDAYRQHIMMFSLMCGRLCNYH